MTKILILIHGHLCNAPRPQKEADSLAKAGHDVTVRGFWFSPDLIERDRVLMRNQNWKFEPVLDFQPAYRLNNLRVRLKSRIAKEQYRYLEWFTPELLNYGVKPMLRAARQAEADLTIVHFEGGLWIGKQLIKEGFRVGVDFEDWFSKDLLAESRSFRPINQLETLEETLIQKCRYCLTTSSAMAESMAKFYKASAPIVVYNSFPFNERALIDATVKDRKNLNIPSLHWFSQTIGPGRGLETLFQALPKLARPVEIHLRGNYPKSAREWLEPQIPQQYRQHCFIHPTVPTSELLSRIAEHDIGLALETPNIVSRDLTVTNKLFQYIQAGLAVVATDTKGQTEVISQMPDCGQLIANNSVVALVEALNELITVPQRLAAAKAAALVAAKNMSWETQERKIQLAVDKALT